MHLQQGTFTIERNADMQQAIGAAWDAGAMVRPVDDTHLLVAAPVDQFGNVRAAIEKITNPTAQGVPAENVTPANVEATGDSMQASQATVGTTRPGVPSFNQPGQPAPQSQTTIVEPGSVNDSAPPPAPPAPQAPQGPRPQQPRIAPPPTRPPAA